jgi:hypothetical protein
MPIKINPVPDVELLKMHLNYNPDTGVFLAKTGGRAGWKIGEPVGFNDRGYLRIHINKKYHAAHRLAWVMTHGFLSDEDQIDHIDGNRSNNSISNLRIASHGANCQNVGIPRHNTSGIKGVHWAASNKKWRAQIKLHGKRYFLGDFNSKEEAAKAYEAASLQMHGEFSRM